MKIDILLNGHNKTFEVAPGEMLLDTLRNHHVLSVRRGCDTSSCGVCTVLVNDKPVLSCSLLSVRANGQKVTTVEGILDEVDKISDHFGAEGADQCGYCNTGMALLVYAMKRELTQPTEHEIRNYLVGNLCRCTGYQSQLKAIKCYMGDES